MSKQDPQIGDRYYNVHRLSWRTIISLDGQGEILQDGELDSRRISPLPSRSATEILLNCSADGTHLWPGDPGCPPDPKVNKSDAAASGAAAIPTNLFVAKSKSSHCTCEQPALRKSQMFDGEWFDFCGKCKSERL